MDNIFMYNPPITVGILSFISAQIIKTLGYAIKYRTFNPERITGAGGMPSSHTSLVIAVMVYFARYSGAKSEYFGFSVLIAGVVIFDALSVRYNAGLHAKELNQMRKILAKLNGEIKDLGGETHEEIEKLSEEKDLKEYLGHRPIEVLAGAAWGIFIGLIFPLP